LAGDYLLYDILDYSFFKYGKTINNIVIIF